MTDNIQPTLCMQTHTHTHTHTGRRNKQKPLPFVGTYKYVNARTAHTHTHTDTQAHTKYGQEKHEGNSVTMETHHSILSHNHFLSVFLLFTSAPSYLSSSCQSSIFPRRRSPPPPPVSFCSVLLFLLHFSDPVNLLLLLFSC